MKWLWPLLHPLPALNIPQEAVPLTSSPLALSTPQEAMLLTDLVWAFMSGEV